MLPPPMKFKIFGPNTANYGQKLAFLVILGQIFGFLVHVGSMPDQKTKGTSRLVAETLLPLQKKLGFGPKNSKIWPKVCSFGHCGPNIGMSYSFGDVPDQKNNENEVPRCFSDMWVPQLLLPPNINRMFGPKAALFSFHLIFTFSGRPATV